MASTQGSAGIRHPQGGMSRMLETPSERTASEAAESSVSPELEVVRLSPSMQLRMRAAQLLREKGWCQGAPMDMNGKLCILGALAMADGWTAGSPNWHSLLFLLTADKLAREAGHSTRPSLAYVW